MSQIFRLRDILSRIMEGQEVFFSCIDTVGDIMTEEVHSLTSFSKISDGVVFLEKHNVRHVPITEEVGPQLLDIPNENLSLIGIVSQRDIARVLPRHQAGHNRNLLEEPIGRIMNIDVITAEPSTSFLQAIQRMVECKIDCLPVIHKNEQNNQLVGILTTTDILKCVLWLESLRHLRGSQSEPLRIVDILQRQGNSPLSDQLAASIFGRVFDVMQGRVASLGPNDPVEKAIILMQSNYIRHIVIADEKGGLKGILSDRDVIRHLSPYIPPTASAPASTGVFREDLFHISSMDESSRQILTGPVSAIMTRHPVTIDASTPLVKVVEVLCDHRFGALPIVDKEDNSLKGIITQTDVLNSIMALGHLWKQENRPKSQSFHRPPQSEHFKPPQNQVA